MIIPYVLFSLHYNGGRLIYISKAINNNVLFLLINIKGVPDLLRAFSSVLTSASDFLVLVGTE